MKTLRLGEVNTCQGHLAATNRYSQDLNPSIWALGAPSVKCYESVSWISGWTAVSSWLSDRELWMVLSSSKSLGSYEFLLGKKKQTPSNLDY